MTLRPGEKSLTPTGNPNNYYTKAEINTALSGKANTATTLAGYGITDGANTALSNLSANGQMIVGSQNGTISNCVLEIPQNIKCSIASNVVTLANGSILTNTGSSYATTTLSADQTYTVDNSLADGNYLLCSNGAAIQAPLALSVTGSGSSLPADDSTYTYFFNITDQLIYKYADGAWSATSYCYPFAEITMSSGVASFAKNSNSNEMIFNGASFIGKHAILYPNVKALIPTEFNDDGTLKNTDYTANALVIEEMRVYGGSSTSCVTISYGDRWAGYTEVDTYEDFLSRYSSATPNTRFYVKNRNAIYLWTGTEIKKQSRIPFAFYQLTGSTITDFSIVQPVRTATVEMLNKKQDNITSITGYNVTKTQTLKNVNGTLTWVDDII